MQQLTSNESLKI